MRAPRRHWLPVRRSARWRAPRLLRLVMSALLVLGLFPGGDELVETVAHLLHDGHLPHSDTHERVAATEDCGGSDEHGCTPLAHHCGCCLSLVALPPALPDLLPSPLQASRDPYRSPHERGPPNAGVKPFLPPPIA